MSVLKKRKSLAIIIPVYNEEDCIYKLIERLLKLKEKMTDLDLSFLFVNDGSTDKSLCFLSDFAENYTAVKIIDFSRNFGHQAALTAGIDYVDADYVAIIDADLQDPPELIEDMYKMAKDGCDIVYGKRLSRKGESVLKKFPAYMFYRVLNILCNTEIPADTGDFRLINRRVVDALKLMREKHRFIRGIVSWVGYKTAALEYHRDERFSGRAKYSFYKSCSLAKNGIYSFSNAPLMLANYLGAALFLLGLSGALLLIYLNFFKQYPVSGSLAVILTIIIFSGLQIMMLGIAGEYIYRIFEEAKNRPLYIVNSTRNL
ncbi:MAG: glycosyltransferase family 2 protein [bacterium]|nr:glycosyltransferase family 2 protein [bacterium]